MRGFSFFLGTDSAGHTNRAGGSLLTGEEFFACDQAGSCALRSAGIRRAPRRGKRVDTCGFYPLNSRFPLFCSLAQTEDRRPLRKGERQRISSSAGEHSVLTFPHLYAMPDSLLLLIWFTLRRRNITVLRNSFTRCYGQHLRIPLYQQTLPQGAPR